MYCQHCGGELTQSDKFCPYCGQPTGSEETVTPQPQPTYQQPTFQQPTYQQPAYQQPTFQQPTYQQPVYQQPQQPIDKYKGFKMGWYKFLIYFSLFAGAVINAFSAIHMLTGSIWANQDLDPEFVYSLLPSLKTWDMVYGVLLLLLAVWSIYTRFQLAGLKKNAPLYLTLLYAGAVVVPVVYTVAVSGILANLTGESSLMSMLEENASSIAASFAMIFINMSYFNKRKSLFVN